MTKKLRKVIEDLGWNIEIYKGQTPNVLELSRYSPAGEDFSFSVDYGTDEKISSAIQVYAHEFDQDEHIEMWVNSTVSGKPSIRVLVQDAEDIDGMLQDLSITVRDFRN